MLHAPLQYRPGPRLRAVLSSLDAGDAVVDPFHGRVRGVEYRSGDH